MAKRSSERADQRGDDVGSFDGLLQQNTGMVKFTAVFLGLLWLFSYLYGSLFLHSTWFESYVGFSVALISSLLSASGEIIELVRLDNGVLGELRTHDNASVFFDASTDGLSIMFTLVAAIIAWPGNLLKKAIAVFLGLSILFLLNIVRVSAMLKVNVYLPLQMDLLNDWVLPGLLVCSAALVFLIWIKASGRHPLESR